MAFLPAKMLEIHDVFDGLTNKSRPNPKSIGEAINIMRQEMIEEATKLDPILFDIFVEFMAEYIGTEKQG
jgi:HD-GYP domain-containing protein (c-di-GMP phosphodiesterase class II)